MKRFENRGELFEGLRVWEDTAANALKQIEEKKYDAELLDEGIPADRILKYGLTFRGKECLIRKANGCL